METNNKDQVLHQRMTRRGTQDKESHADLHVITDCFLRVARQVGPLVGSAPGQMLRYKQLVWQIETHWGLYKRKT
jgi:hypothetical protein